MIKRKAFTPKALYFLAALALIAVFFSGCAIPIPNKIPIPKFPIFSL